jgi:hypothetical protein
MCVLRIPALPIYRSQKYRYHLLGIAICGGCLQKNRAEAGLESFFRLVEVLEGF